MDQCTVKPSNICQWRVLCLEQGGWGWSLPQTCLCGVFGSVLFYAEVGRGQQGKSEDITTSPWGEKEARRGRLWEDDGADRLMEYSVPQYQWQKRGNEAAGKTGRAGRVMGKSHWEIGSGSSWGKGRMERLWWKQPCGLCYTESSGGERRTNVHLPCSTYPIWILFHPYPQITQNSGFQSCWTTANLKQLSRNFRTCCFILK